jgi:hypothetical protein
MRLVQPAGRPAAVGSRCRRSGADDREMVIPGHACPLRENPERSHAPRLTARGFVAKLTPPCG